MSIPGSATPLFLASTAAGPGPAAYSIERSLRFNSADSAYLNRTPASAGNRKTWTWSGWVKKTASAATDPKTLFGVYGGSASTSFTLRFDPATDDTLRVENDFTVGAPGGRTVAVFRDYSGWMHVVVSMDTTQSSAASGLKMYVNGVQQTLQNTVWTQNIETLVNSTNAHYIGSQGQANSYLDGYLADVHFIDGQALAPTDFGEYDDNNVWQPKAYSGTYGTNGFHLDFSDSSSNAALGTDSSTNNNDWTVNNITAEAPGLATAKQGMDVVTYSGTGATQAIGGLQFQPDFVWIKRRNGANTHALFDVIRGVTKVLESSNTGAEKTNDPPITSFDSNGFTVNGTYAQTNASGGTYVGWCWRAGGTASSNTDGSITSQVSANTTYGFSIVSYTGNGSTSATTIGHGLNAQPGMIIVKNRDAALNWVVLHQSFTDRIGKLNLTDAFDTGYVSYGDGAFDPAGSTSTVFATYPGTSTNNFGNALNNKYIAYCWSEVAGFSKFGSYTGTGAVGHKITTGFKPAYILFKRTDSLSNWRIVDEKRGTSSLNAETAEAEQTLNFAINADGFTINETGNNPNASGGTYIYAAFAGTPAGEETDSLFDSPQNGIQTDTGAGGEVSGNYCTWNPLTKGASVTLQNGNLEAVNTGTGSTALGTIGLAGQKWYMECTRTADAVFGVANSLANTSTNPGVGLSNSWSWYSNDVGTMYFVTNGSFSSWTLSKDLSDTLQIAVDATDITSIKVYAGINNTWYDSSGSTTNSPDNSGSPTATITSGLNVFPLGGAPNASNTLYANFGQRDFTYTAPSGYKALNTANLSDPTIADGSDYMDVVTYTATGGTPLVVGDPVFSATADSGIVSASQIFNGSTSDGGYYNGTGTDITLTTSPFTINTSLRVYQNFRSDGTYAICLNSSCVNVPGTGTDSTAFRWSTVDLSTFTLPLSVTKLGYSLSQNSGNTIRAIEVDGTILINGAGQPLSFKPDMVWLKARVAGAHNLFDSVRGATKGLRSNDTPAEYTDSETLTSFDSNGFSLGTDSGGYQVNYSNNPMVGWTWDAGHPATATTGAVSFDGTGDYLSLPASSDFNFGSGDFTIEFFWYPTSTSRQALYHGSFGADYSIGIDYNSVGTNKLGFWASSNGTNWDIVNADSGGSGITTGEPIQKAWNHIAYVRNGNSFTMYLNGGSVGSITSTATISLADTDIPVIGAWWNSNIAMSDVHGSISNFRILKGTALYTSNFTPPTAELTNVTNTKLLCCQSTTSATTAAVAPGAITANGDASATTFNPLDAFSVNGTGHATTSAAGITEGTITLTGASVNRSLGFSIVSYTGTGAAATVGHGLNAAPKMIIFKNRDAATNWRVYTTMIDGSMDSLFLNTTAAKTDSSLSAFTNSVFYCGTNSDHNGSGQGMIAYCFAPVEGYSAFGSYTGNGSATDGPFVYTGFRSRWIMIKRSVGGIGDWEIFDTSRDVDNIAHNVLLANGPDAEISLSSRELDILSNGFKIKSTATNVNASGSTYLYACFSENPFKYARAR